MKTVTFRCDDKGGSASMIRVEDGIITEIGPFDSTHVESETIDVSGLRTLPGFIDVHIHGAVGVDVNTANVDGLMTIAEFLAKNGVTAWMPTLVPDSDENYRRAIDAIDGLMEIQYDRPIAQAVGVHYEGVFANEKMCGALRPEYFKKFTAPGMPSAENRPADEASAPLLRKEGSQNAAPHHPDRSGHPSFERRGAGGELLELPRLKKGVHMTTLAPEVEGGIELIKELKRHGWVVAMGHTNAEPEVLDAAFAAGARHMTHFFNAMTGVHHRGLGVAGWGLTNDNVTFDIIADGIHVHPKMLEFACRCKSTENVSLISDSVAPTGLGDGEYELWGENITVENGRTRNERGSIAGSVITMLDAVNRMRSLGFADHEVSKMASLNPAKLLGLEALRGSVEVGKRADIVALDDEGNVKLTMIGGEIVN